MIRSALLAQEPVAVPLKEGAAEWVLLLQPSAKGVVAVAGFGGDGAVAVRGPGDRGLLQLVFHVPFEPNECVPANALFCQVAVGVVAVALVFEDFEAVVPDQALAGRGRGGVLACPRHRQQVVRGVEGKAFGQAGLDAAQDAPDAVVAVARSAVSQVVDAPEVARRVVLVAPPQDGAALACCGGVRLDVIAQCGPRAGAWAVERWAACC